MGIFKTTVLSGWFALFGASSLIGGSKMETLDLMPVPYRLQPQDGPFRLDSAFTVSVEGAATPRLCRAATRMLRRLSDRTGLFFAQNILTLEANSDHPTMIVRADREGSLELGEDESYSLDVSERSVLLSAKTEIGVLRGLETFLQLLDSDSAGYRFPCVSIQDKPRFQWRGLLMDVCRHFMPVEVIKRNLDGMAAAKLNVLHWHLTEDQGFRVECKTFPKLHGMGSDGLYYTHEQIRDVVEYAKDRGIRVMPEFDMPGHTTSWFVGYPELASAPGPYEIERHWGIGESPVMNPASGKTYRFLGRFFKEMVSLFPDEYVHIGGDEVVAKQWEENPKIQKFMKKHNLKDYRELQNDFNLKVQKILNKYGKKMVGWDEILHPSLVKNSVIQSWRGRDVLVAAAKQGYKTILSNGYYIDLIYPAEAHYLNDPLTPDMGLTESEAENILGGEATMWSEFVTPETVDSRVWPRTAAIAERLWSAASVCDVDDMVRRLEAFSLRLEEQGLTHEKNYEMMLRRLAAGPNIEPLKTLVDVVEPVKEYKRSGQKQYTSFSPMTRVVDAARPDSRVARKFNKRVDELLGGCTPDSVVPLLKADLSRWRENHPLLLPLIRRSPILREIETLSSDLSVCAEIGLEALGQKETGRIWTADWILERKTKIDSAQQPRGQVELVVLDGIRKLLEWK